MQTFVVVTHDTWVPGEPPAAAGSARPTEAVLTAAAVV